MPLLRIILIAIFLAIVVHLARRYFSRRKLTQTRQLENSGNLVRCDYCGLHIPQSDAVQDNERYYCSEEHRDRNG